MTDRPGRTALAALSAGAGAIHLAMVPSHAGESALEGAGFAAAGWLQLVAAALLLLRPTAAVLRATAALNAGLILAWGVSRTIGAEEATLVDLTCVGLEAALVAGALGLRLVRVPAAAWAVPVVALGVTTNALVSPSARDHAASGHGTTAAAADDLGLSELGNGHQHAHGEVEVDAATRRALNQQLARTAELVTRYPTIAAAEAAGYRRAGPFSAGLGTHYISPRYAMNADGRMDAEDIANPTLIFDGLGPDAPLAGFMYFAGGAQGEPEGFAGPNDHWHYHTNTCVVFRDGVVEAPLGADRDVSEALCRRYGGTLIRNTGYMVHVWTVPGYESERGVFSEINPELRCPDGTYHMRPIEELGFSTTMCRT